MVGVAEKTEITQLNTGGDFFPASSGVVYADESVRQALKRLKTNWKRAKQWITSPDPQYLLKKHATG